MPTDDPTPAEVLDRVLHGYTAPPRLRAAARAELRRLRAIEARARDYLEHHVTASKAALDTAYWIATGEERPDADTR